MEKPRSYKPPRLKERMPNHAQAEQSGWQMGNEYRPELQVFLPVQFRARLISP